MPRLELAGIEIEGTRALEAVLQKLGNEAVPALAEGLYQEAEAMMTDAKVLTPVDTGNLRASGHVALPEIQGTAVSVALGFGGPAGSGNHGGQSNAESVGYAVYVHEDMTKHHPVGQAKFLETPAKARTAGMSARLAQTLTRRWRRIVGR